MGLRRSTAEAKENELKNEVLRKTLGRTKVCHLFKMTLYDNVTKLNMRYSCAFVLL